MMKMMKIVHHTTINLRHEINVTLETEIYYISSQIENYHLNYTPK